jgi:hypothetical protein
MENSEPNKIKYALLIASQKNIAVFQNPWWMDATAGNNNWDVWINEQSKTAFVYHFKKKYFQKALLPAIVTPYQSNFSNNNFFYERINNFDFVEFNVKDCDAIDVEELRKNNFDYKLKHTRIVDVKDVTTVYTNYKSSVKRQIQKAEKNLTVVENENLEVVYAVIEQVFQRQKKATPFSFLQLKKIDIAAKQNNSRNFWIAYNSYQQPCAALYVVFDSTCCYCIIGGIATAHKDTGAMCLLYHKAIQFASTRCNEIDFCGSTIPSIDKFFSTFGAVKKNVLVINKYNNRLQKWAINKWKK